MKDKKIKFTILEVIIISLVSSIIMSACTGYIVFKSKNKYASSSDEYLDEFTESYNNIVDNYYSSIDKEKLIDAAISGMLNYLGDPYTTYLDKYSTDNLTDSLSGSFNGIGVSIGTMENGSLVVLEVFDESPAKEAGIMVGDVLYSINDTLLTGKTSTDAVNLIKDSETINIVVKRDGQLLEFKTTKTNLDIPSVYSSYLEHNDRHIGLLQITKFNETAADQFKKQLSNLEAKGIYGLIIDLRGNTGGYLAQATKIAKMFLEKDKIIYSLQEQNGTKVSLDDTDESRDMPLYILVNGSSASASEILAAALKDSYGAKLVGTNTYGKGKVQKTSELSDGTMYKYTSAKWLTPSGECIDGFGLAPDIKVVATDEYKTNPTMENDTVLNTALEEITK